MARTTPNMGLTVWNNGTDFFSRLILAGDWDAIDAHDHAAGNGVQIPTGGIANAAVTAPKIAPNAVDSSKIAANAVGATQIAPGAVGATQLAVNAVDSTKIAASALSHWKTIATAYGSIGAGVTAGTYVMPNGAVFANSGFTASPFPAIPIDPADYALSGKTTKFRTKIAAYWPSNNAGAQMTIGLYSASANTAIGANSQIGYTLTSLVTGSTFASPGSGFGSGAAGSTFGDSSTSLSVSTEYTLLKAQYLFGVVLGGTTAANSMTHLTARLEYHHV